MIELMTSFFLIFTIDLGHLHLRLSVCEVVPFRSEFVLLLGSLSLCNLLLLLSSLVLSLPILALHLLLDLLFFFGQIPSDLEHLLIGFVHLDQIISGPLVRNLHLFKLLENILSIMQGHLVGVNFFGSLIEVLAKFLLGSGDDVFIDVHFRRLVFDVSLETAPLGILDKLSSPNLAKEFSLSVYLIDLLKLLTSYFLIKMLHHSKLIYKYYTHKRMNIHNHEV